MLGELEPLPLIIRGLVLAVENVRHLGKRFVIQTPDRLSMLEHERHFMTAHFEHRARAGLAIEFESSEDR